MAIVYPTLIAAGIISIISSASDATMGLLSVIYTIIIASRSLSLLLTATHRDSNMLLLHTEVVKFIIFIAYRNFDGEHNRSVLGTSRITLTSSIGSALLYSLQTLQEIWIFSRFDASLYLMAIQLKIVLTAVARYVIMGSPLTREKVYAFVLLTLGVLVSQTSCGSDGTDMVKFDGELIIHSVAGAAMLSLANVMTEAAFKSTSDIAGVQVIMSLTQVFVGVVFGVLHGTAVNVPLQIDYIITLIITVIQSIIVVFIISKGNANMKNCVAAVSTCVSTCVIQMALNHEANMNIVQGMLIICFSMMLASKTDNVQAIVGEGSKLLP